MPTITTTTWSSTTDGGLPEGVAVLIQNLSSSGVSVFASPSSTTVATLGFEVEPGASVSFGRQKAVHLATSAGSASVRVIRL